ncbi:MAG: GLPGLI family protein, partial [Bacteroidetes bacterium]|nr:GLPGLI family protein [Bacteroidota bacterium]
MNIKTPLFIILSFLLPQVSQAQIFITKGVITFERKVQTHKILEDNEWVKANMASIPKFYLSTFQLHFNEDTLLYHKVGEDEPNSASWAIFARENEVVTIFSTGQSVVKKTVYNDDFMIKDSLPKYRWKLVNETRKIAGVECKKATTIINDSIYVVAFYAETIMVSGGPEQFCGLPGMIL